MSVNIQIYISTLTIIQFGFPTAHKLTFLSSPPVTNTLPDLCPRETQLTLAPWATNSSEIWMSKNWIYREKLLIILNINVTQFHMSFLLWVIILTQLPGPFRNTWRVCHFSVEPDSTLFRLKLIIICVIS